MLAVVSSPTSERVVVELVREAVRVDLVTTAVLDDDPAHALYLIAVDAPRSAALAERFVAWAAAARPLRPGLIGIVEGGGARESEALLAAGFDDVVVTPVSARELVGRVRAVHRRVHWKGVPTGRLRFGELTLDVHGRSLWIDGRAITLTSIELAVVRELMKARGRPRSRADLLDTAWRDGELEITERAVDNVILRLRRKLPRPVIETVRGVGFRLAGG